MLVHCGSINVMLIVIRSLKSLAIERIIPYSWRERGEGGRGEGRRREGKGGGRGRRGGGGRRGGRGGEGGGGEEEGRGREGWGGGG